MPCRLKFNKTQHRKNEDLSTIMAKRDSQINKLVYNPKKLDISTENSFEQASSIYDYGFDI